MFGKEVKNGRKDENGESEETTDDSEVKIETPIEDGNIGDYIIVHFDGYCGDTDEDGKGSGDDGTANVNPATGASASARTRSIIKYLSDDTPHENKDNKPPAQPFIQARNWLIKLGNGDVLPGLEMAIRFLKLNQCAIVKCHSKYAYGPFGRNNACGGGSGGTTTQRDKQTRREGVAVPPNTNIIYKLQIINIQSQNDVNTQSNSFQMKVLKEMKNIGNHYYKHDWIGSDGGNGKIRALKLYKEISRDGQSMLQDLDHGTDERREVFYITVDSLNNISAVHLREKEYRKAKDAASEALQLDPYNLKALCRAAKSALMLGEYEECKIALNVADEIADEGDPDQSYGKTHVQRLKRELIQKKREQKKLEREIYSQMLLCGKKDCSDKDNHSNDDKNNVQKKRGTIDHDSQEEAPQNVFSRMGVTYILVPLVAIMLYFLLQQHL